MSRRRRVRPRASRGSWESGQGLVEFALVLVPFLVLVMAIADLGRGVYMNNGVAQAAREIARTTSVHPCNPSSCTLGNSAETLATIATQRNLVPGLSAPGAVIAIQCTTITDTSLSNATCRSGSFVRVTVSVPFRVVTPMLSMVAPTTLSSASHIQVP